MYLYNFPISPAPFNSSNASLTSSQTHDLFVFDYYWHINTHLSLYA